MKLCDGCSWNLIYGMIKLFDDSNTVAFRHHLSCLDDNLNSNNENIYLFMTEYGINMRIFKHEYGINIHPLFILGD